LGTEDDNLERARDETMLKMEHGKIPKARKVPPYEVHHSAFMKPETSASSA